ncbi:MAG: N-6 DNA methylase, partial [Actinomycetota bacterium]|nr:N-6 DNA methylase [Actinomycetota bacterium]
MAPRNPFATITTEGGLLSSDLLARLARQPNSLSGTSPDDYHLLSGRRLRDAINRSWTELQGAWTTFATELAKLPAGERATTITRERWLLPLFAELGFGRLQRASAITVAGREYPISHLWGAVPIHLLGADVELDRRSKGVAGAATAAPSSMVQELLNRSEDHLWAILSNGRRLRLLRDNTSLTRAAYAEFDLEAMFAGQVFTDFALLWMVCHESRFEAEQPEQCWLERWIGEARQQGVRALDTLRTGFEKAITVLGSGFLAQPANAELRGRLRDGKLSVEDYHRQVLRLVYRLVFLLVAEDRDLFHPPATSDQARRHYARYYSLGRIRDHARRHRGTRHSDLFESVAPVVAALGANGIAMIGVPALGSFLWSADACADLDAAALSNNDLLEAVRHLAYTEQDRALQRVDFANLGPEELGSIYESLLELHPRIETHAARFELFAVAGNERKSTGSYYTPTSLISALLDKALDPLLDEAEGAPEPQAAILSIKVLDPACGSGHFLTAAARRIAARLASVETGELNPTPEAIRHALRQVVGRCIYGIDLNPMAAELAKVNLWLDAVEPGLPLSFLDHHIVWGNGLIGTNPRLIEEGIPDEAFKPIEGDDKSTAAARKKTNAAERRQRNQGLLALGDSALSAAGYLADAVRAIDAEDDTTVEGIRRMQRRWAELQTARETQLATLVADTWCAAFFVPKTPEYAAITDQTLRAIAGDRTDSPDVIAHVTDLSAHYHFLHPHLAFPDVFAADPAMQAGWEGGFDLVLGNPPWDTLNPEVKSFFGCVITLLLLLIVGSRIGLVVG